MMKRGLNGKLWRNGRYTKTLRFYNEREWRFVPRNEPFKYGIPKEIFLDDAERTRCNTEIWNKVVLRFKHSNIKYIIVSEEEIIDIIKEIEQIKNKYNQDEIKLLCSRVISAEQIYEDF